MPLRQIYGDSYGGLQSAIANADAQRQAAFLANMQLNEQRGRDATQQMQFNREMAMRQAMQEVSNQDRNAQLELQRGNLLRNLNLDRLNLQLANRKLANPQLSPVDRRRAEDDRFGFFSNQAETTGGVDTANPEFQNLNPLEQQTLLSYVQQRQKGFDTQQELAVASNKSSSLDKTIKRSEAAQPGWMRRAAGLVIRPEFLAGTETPNNPDWDWLGGARDFTTGLRNWTFGASPEPLPLDQKHMEILRRRKALADSLVNSYSPQERQQMIRPMMGTNAPVLTRPAQFGVPQLQAQSGFPGITDAGMSPFTPSPWGAPSMPRTNAPQFAPGMTRTNIPPAMVTIVMPDGRTAFQIPATNAPAALLRYPGAQVIQ